MEAVKWDDQEKERRMARLKDIINEVEKSIGGLGISVKKAMIATKKMPYDLYELPKLKRKKNWKTKTIWERIGR